MMTPLTNCYFRAEGPREALEGGGVNGSQNKFFFRNRPMSQVQTPTPKLYKKVMVTPINSVEMSLSMLRMQRKKNGINQTPG
jgi:hypothetical protein